MAAIRDIAAKTLAGVVPTSRQIERLSDDEIVARLTEVLHKGLARQDVIDRVRQLGSGATPSQPEETQKFLAQENADLTEADWKVTCLRFAPNAPEQNPTEDVWLKGKTHLRKLFALNKTFAQVKRCFSTFLQALQFTSTKLSWYWPTEQII